MRNKIKNEKSNDIEKVKNFLDGLGFICDSCSSAQHFIYNKDGERVIIKNNKR